MQIAMIGFGNVGALLAAPGLGRAVEVSRIG